MAISKTKRNVRSRSASNGASSLLPRLTADAQQILAVNRDLAAKAIEKFRKDVEQRAQRAIRELERKVLKQMHVATEERVHRLEARVARLEQHDVP